MNATSDPSDEVPASPESVDAGRDKPEFADHFSTVAAQYASARPDYPDALFDWIAGIASSRERVWEAGCGSGQATRGLASRFERVYATDPSAAQIAQANGPSNVEFAVEPAEACGLPDASVDAVCVAQALHWFDRPRFFAECARVLKPGGVLVAWGYQDIEVPEDLRTAVGGFSARIRDAWPTERYLVDRAYIDFLPLFDAPPFERLATDDLPVREITVDWSLMRMLEYFSSYSAVKRYREANGIDPVAAHAWDIAIAWRESDKTRRLRWPLFVHARRKGA
ncbi:MAG: methyltransferase domain-containing protein [Xanthomonadaceae bacterium]|nr:methyltransferase domain-containing protein [Xanthomonadaceae bacterium]